ncbi:SMP-30/gluconolactonase/LRE family protein [bacterium]|nr:SMP-30/gluconolactonase/LRE family protein [bacterium]
MIRFLLITHIFFSSGGGSLSAQEGNVKFHRISLEQELSHGTVYSILQDRKGFLWVATEGGLNRYDGYEIKTFMHDPMDSNSIANGNVSAILEDRYGFLWLATWGGGLDRYDPANEKFYHYKHDPTNSQSISDDRVQTLFEDHKGNLWIGTYSGGLNLFNIEKETFSVFKHDPLNPASISHDRVWAIAEDSSRNLWFATGDGLNKLSAASPQTRFITYKNIPGNSRSLSHNFIRSLYVDHAGQLWVGTQNGLNRMDPKTLECTRYLNPNNNINSIYEDKNGLIWFGTLESGLMKYDPKTDRLFQFTNEAFNPNSLSYNDVRVIYADRTDNLWIGTRGGGLNKLDLKPAKFNLMSNNPADANSLIDNRVWAIYEEEKKEGNILWVSTDKGLDRYDMANDLFYHYVNDLADPNSISSNFTRGIFQDKDGYIWVGTSGGGLNRLDPQNGKFKRYINDPQNPASLSDNRVRVIHGDSAGLLWIGTYKGLNRFDPMTGLFKSFHNIPNDPRSLSSNEIRAIAEDRDGNLWIGTYGGGLNQFDKTTERFVRYTHDENDVNSISGNDILSIVADPDGRTLWVGTQGSGLNRFDIQTKKNTRITTNDGLANDVVHGILIDAKGNLWISTNKGLSKFNVHAPHALGNGKKSDHWSSFRNYDVHDGLQSNIFGQGAYYKNSKGRMYFGGVGGINFFDPDDVKGNPYSPTVVITEFSKFDKPVYLGRALQDISSIELSYKDNFFSFEFAALDFTMPEKNQYQYMLEGFDPEWSSAGYRRYATYTNVNPGTYYFKVNGSNNDNVWSKEPVSIKIVIVPPFWKTWWFVIFAGTAFFLLIYAGYRYRIRNIQTQKFVLEREVAERTAELKRSKDELEKINEIVKSVNSEFNFADVLQSILEKSTQIKNIERACALTYDNNKHVFRYVASAGWDMRELQQVTLTPGEAEARYGKEANIIAEDISIVSNVFRQAGSEKMTHMPCPKCMLIMKIRIQDTVEGYLVFDNMTDENAFNNENLGILINLKEHFISAFIKTRLLEDLKTLNDKKNEFLGIAAHDLRNPLGTINGYLKIMLEDLENNAFDPEESKGDLMSMIKTSEHMNRLIAELLDISAIESGKVHMNMQRVNLIEILEEREKVHQRSALQKNIRMTFNKDIDRLEINADWARISEVLDNLISNAIKFTFPGGHVAVTCLRDAVAAVIHVEDTGQGFSQEDLKNVFVSFKKLSARPTGGESSTGLGLAIVKKVVEMHGGRVWVESEKGKGSVFSFSLPLPPS